MGFFDKFKKGKQETAPEKIEEQKADVKSETTPAASKKPAVPVIRGLDGADLLLKPLLSEKAMMLASSGRYVFMVRANAKKPEIKKSVQRIYNVHVEDVKIVNLPSKKRRTGAQFGRTSAHKKAIVVLKEGEKIAGIIESVG